MTQNANMITFKGSRLARGLLAAFGWRVEFNGVPTKKGVIIAYPHTSNWDFIVGILAKWTIGIPVKFWGKSALFTGAAKYTLGPFMRYWGGVPVDRSSSHGLIDSTLAEMERNDFFWLALAPEGTRSKTDYWRSGFYQVALKAKVPLMLAAFNFNEKRVIVTEYFELSGDESADIARIKSYYDKTAQGCKHELAGTIQFKPK